MSVALMAFPMLAFVTSISMAMTMTTIRIFTRPLSAIISTPIFISRCKVLQYHVFCSLKADFTFNLQNSLRVGLGFEGLGNSFAANLKEYGSVYIQRSSMEFSSYLQYPLTKNILLNLRGGYGLFRRFRIFEADDTVKFSLMNIFFKDPRTPLNQSVQDGPFFNLRLIYRYYLPKKN